LLGHDRLETTARYSRVAIGMIAKIESPLDTLSTRECQIFCVRGLCEG
jgi:hypothetical protein